MSRPSFGQPCTCTCVSLYHLLFVVCLPIAPASIKWPSKGALLSQCCSHVLWCEGKYLQAICTYVQTIGTRDIARHVASRRVCPHIHIICMPTCVRCLHVLAQARPMMTCIALVYIIFSIPVVFASLIPLYLFALYTTPSL